jgi:hypothetical protein
VLGVLKARGGQTNAHHVHPDGGHRVEEIDLVRDRRLHARRALQSIAQRLVDDFHAARAAAEGDGHRAALRRAHVPRSVDQRGVRVPVVHGPTPFESSPMRIMVAVRILCADAANPHGAARHHAGTRVEVRPRTRGSVPRVRAG